MYDIFVAKTMVLYRPNSKEIAKAIKGEQRSGDRRSTLSFSRWRMLTNSIGMKTKGRPSLLIPTMRYRAVKRFGLSKNGFYRRKHITQETVNDEYFHMIDRHDLNQWNTSRYLVSCQFYHKNQGRDVSYNDVRCGP
jgi:hypothetical protein